MMAIGWFLAPFKTKMIGPREIRYCAIDDFTDDIRSVGGAWDGTRIDDNTGIMLVRATQEILNKIKLGSDVAITSVEDPTPYWKSTKTSPISNKISNNRTIEDISKCLLDDKKWGELKALAESLAKESDQKGYIKIAKGDWAITAQLLVFLGKAGYGMDKISTGTFPTTGVLDTFDRADSVTTIGGNWTILKVYVGSTDYGISTNQAYNPDGGCYTSLYYNLSTYGADSEAYMTLGTVPGDVADSIDLHVRVTSPGGSFDSYDLCIDLDNPPEDWEIYEITDGTGAALAGGTTTQAIANGYKVGLEVIGNVITGYVNTGSAWAAVLSKSDATLTTAGYLGMYGTANTTWRYNDFGGGTVVAAGGVPIAIYKKYYDYRRAQ
jgi:hypothetical protein